MLSYTFSDSEWYQVSQKKVPTFKIHSNKNASEISIIQILVKAERLKYHCDLSHCLTSTGSIGKFEIDENFMVAKWQTRGLKHWSNPKDSPCTEQYTMGVSSLSRVTRHHFQTNNKDCQSHGNTVSAQLIISHPWTIACFYRSVRGVLLMIWSMF